ncbi:delta-like protein B [Trichoplusia ni]|uniref:Delta-like protein B n=1 Tax=Trichoplusia ni TaxID=7111 RepID=A0A7E5WLC1_TRINI|nr:delta-like protein B [Trichoplusia ni]
MGRRGESRLSLKFNSTATVSGVRATRLHLNDRKMWSALVIVVCCVSGVLPARHLPKWKKQACELPAVQSEHSHYVCDDKGEPKCLPGWQGDLCDVPICKKGCDPLQGYCKRPGECRCKLGFYGERCNKCIPLPGCQHGYCNESFECICKQGWDGLFCSEPICRSDCHATRGFCEMPGECRCKLGWAGKTCRSCQQLPGCQHGYCDKPLECKCLPGYTGLLCQTPICSAGCHTERGYCRRPGECRCKVGWTGTFCNECHRYPGCLHGTCNKPWECICKEGWGGMLCDEELNYCEKNPDTCQNGGECQSLESGEGSFRCHCKPGTTGKNCEILPEVQKPANGTTSEDTTEVPDEEVDSSSQATSTEIDNGENETE